MTGRRDYLAGKEPVVAPRYLIPLYELRCLFWTVERGIKKQCGKPAVFAIAKHANGSLPMRFACDKHKNKVVPNE